MPSNDNNDDFFTTTSRLSKAVTTTASALMTSTTSKNSNNNFLMNSTHYQKAIYDTLINPQRHKNVQKESDQLINKYTKRRAPSEILRWNLNKDEIGYKAITHIPDSLLSDIPEENSKFSLFQGFTASIPQVNEELNIFKEIKDMNDNGKLTITDGLVQKKINNPLPLSVSSKKIRNSKSAKNLNIYKQQILKKMHYLEIRKELSSNEISELDDKINKLTKMRDAIFQKVAKIEKDEIYLEGFIDEITARLNSMDFSSSDDKFEDSLQDQLEEEPEEVGENEENGLESTNTSNNTESEEDKFNKGIHFDEPVLVNEEEDGDDEFDTSSEDYDLIDDSNNMLLTQSMYTNIQKKPPVFHKLSHKNRKIKPTLQKYYTPGSVISEFVAHEMKVTCCDFDYPFGTLTSASQDGSVRVWDLSTKKNMALLEGHSMEVSCMQMDDNLLVTGSKDSNLKLWDLSRLNRDDDDGDSEDVCVYTFESHIDDITALHFEEYELVSGSSDRTIRQWDMQTGHCKQTLDVLYVVNSVKSPMESSMSMSVQNMSNAPFISALQCYSAALASGTADGIVRLWDLRSGDVIRSLTGHTDAITTLQFDDSCLVTGSADESIKVWDLRTGKIQNNLQVGQAVRKLQFDHEKIVYCGAGDGRVSIYDRTSAETVSLGQKDWKGTPCDLKYMEGYLVSGYADGKVRSWAM